MPLKNSVKTTWHGKTSITRTQQLINISHIYWKNYWFSSVKVIKCTFSFAFFFTDNLKFSRSHVAFASYRKLSLQSLWSVQHTYNKLSTRLIWALLTGSRVHGIFLSGLCVCVNLDKDNLQKTKFVGQPHDLFFSGASFWQWHC